MKEVKDMTIAEVLQTQVFADKMKAEIDSINMLLKFGNYKYKRNAVDRLEERGFWNVRDMTMLFAQVLDKQCVLPANERRCVLYTGVKVYQKTMKKLLEDEKAGNECNGDSKQ